MGLGIKDLPDDLVIHQLPRIGGHQAAQNPAKQGGTCSVLLAVTRTSRFTATVTAGINLHKACRLALRLARLAEPEIP